jgi:hypothetical protein
MSFAFGEIVVAYSLRRADQPVNLGFLRPLAQGNVKGLNCPKSYAIWQHSFEDVS